MTNDKFRILCIDGGGIRGIIPAIWLAKLEEDLHDKGVNLVDAFDLICGTSTGSILAAAVACGVPMSQVVNLFEDDGPKIFKTPYLGIMKNARNLLRAKYNGKALTEALEGALGNKQMEDAKTNLCITAYDIENRRSTLIRSYDQNTKDVEIWEACKASSAAPTYFPPHYMKINGARRILIDGGVIANNPSSLAVAEAISISRKVSLRAFGSDITLISMGTGNSTRDLCGRKHGPQGAIGWAKPILDVMFDGSSSISDHIARQILDPRYYVRMQLELLQNSGSDDLDKINDNNIEKLRGAASAYMSTNPVGSENYHKIVRLIAPVVEKPRKATPRADLPTPT